jgi:hypothetical protein
MILNSTSLTPQGIQILNDSIRTYVYCILKIGIIENYNNNILIATTNMKPVKNNINNIKNIPQPLMEGSKSKVFLPKANQLKVTKTSDELKTETKIKLNSQDKLETHENMKYIIFALTSGFVCVAIYFYK